MGYNNMVVTKQVYFSSAILKSWAHISHNIASLLLYRRLTVPTSSLAHLFAIRGRRKRGLEHFTNVMKICSNRGHIFKNKLRKTLAAVLKTSHVRGYVFLYSACRARDKNKIKTYERAESEPKLVRYLPNLFCIH